MAGERRNYNALPVDSTITAEQLQLADTFLGLGLMPLALRVADAVYPVSVLPGAD